MCGIAGVMSLGERPVQRTELQLMCAAMVHRGPDDEGIYLQKGIGLGMRRLSIIDLDTGQQPVCNEAATVWVVLNGEIYNFKELRDDLQKRGHRFRSNTDTEVIVHLYEEWGLDCVQHLRGMFAFALWDEQANRLMLARDRLGIKPLYYAEINGRLLFASELKSLLQLPEVDRRLNLRAVSHLFSFQTTPATESIVAGIAKLEPGHMLLSKGHKWRLQRYWDASFEPETGRSVEYFVDGLQALLRESVDLHMRSDVPLGAFLSGGLDSSAIVATMAHLSSSPVQTFSIGFSEQEFNELAYARMVAKRFGSEHHELIVGPDIETLIDDLAWHLDEPFGDPSAIPTYLVSRLAARHVTVVLSGDGGDELFGGYDKYVVEGRERLYEPMAAPVRLLLRSVANALPVGTKGKNFLRHFALTGADRYLDAVAFYPAGQSRQLFSEDVVATLNDDGSWREALTLLNRDRGHWLSSLQYFDLQRYLPLDILTKLDRMSMAHSIEARVPLLDHKLVEFAGRIPAQLKLHGSTTKYIFKQAMRGILPDAVIDRPKQGFAVPLGHWFRGPLAGFLREHLLSERSRARGIFDFAYIEQLIDLHERGRPLDQQLWTLLSFELWCRRFLDRGVTSTSMSALRPPHQHIADTVIDINLLGETS